jgi:hypothetical protein
MTNPDVTVRHRRGQGRGEGTGQAESAFLPGAIVGVGPRWAAPHVGAVLAIRSQLAAGRMVVPNAVTRFRGRGVARPITAAGSGRVRASRDGSSKGPEGTIAPGLFFPKGVEVGADPSELLTGALRCC